MIEWYNPDDACSATAEGFASRVARTTGVLGFRAAHAAGSRGDFLQALQLLGAQPSVRRLGSGDPRLMAGVHLTCSRAMWVEVFGEPQSVEQQRMFSAQHARHLWKHSCTDGPITCAGHLFERSPGVPWVVVTRVALL